MWGGSCSVVSLLVSIPPVRLFGDFAWFWEGGKKGGREGGREERGTCFCLSSSPVAAQSFWLGRNPPPSKTQAQWGNFSSFQEATLVLYQELALPVKQRWQRWLLPWLENPIPHVHQCSAALPPHLAWGAQAQHPGQALCASIPRGHVQLHSPGQKMKARPVQLNKQESKSPLPPPLTHSYLSGGFQWAGIWGSTWLTTTFVSQDWDEEQHTLAAQALQTLMNKSKTLKPINSSVFMSFQSRSS